MTWQTSSLRRRGVIIAAASFIALSGRAEAVVLVDSIMTPDSSNQSSPLSNSGFGDWTNLAAQFTLTEAATITDIQALLYVVDGGTLTLQIMEDAYDNLSASGIPIGYPLDPTGPLGPYTTDVEVGTTTGAEVLTVASGLNWQLDAGTYWLAGIVGNFSDLAFNTFSASLLDVVSTEFGDGAYQTQYFPSWANSGQSKAGIRLIGGTMPAYTGDAHLYPAADVGAELAVGETAVGSLTVHATDTIDVLPGSAPAGATCPCPAPNLSVGSQSGGDGTVTIDGGAINVSGSNTGATAFIGGRPETSGGVATVNVQNGGQLNVTDPALVAADYGNNLANMVIGFENATGTLNADGGIVNIGSTSGAFLVVGQGTDGTGTANFVNGSALSLHDQDTGTDYGGANLTVGSNASPDTAGTLNVVDSTVSIVSDNQDASLFIARGPGSTGTATINGPTASVEIDGHTDAGFRVGEQAGSVGTLTLTNGAILTANSDQSAWAEIGQQAGSVGNVTVSGGSQIDVSGVDSGWLGVAAAFGADAGTGTLVVTDPGSMVTASSGIIVGAPESAGGGSASGVLTVSNGGEIDAPVVRVGVGGTLNGNGGTISGNVINDGGTIAPGHSPGTMDILGDLELLSGELEIEIAGTDVGQYDMLNVSGALIAPSGFDLTLSFLDGFVPQVGDTFDFLNIAGDSSGFVPSMIALSLLGLPTGFQFSLNSFDTNSFAVTVDAVAAVPIPAALPLFGSALGGAGLFGWRRKKRAAAAAG